MIVNTAVLAIDVKLSQIDCASMVDESIDHESDVRSRHAHARARIVQVWSP